ncbi:T9SS C-terminal target domain-containing protein [Sphingobacteriales bacterium UPWRP_1]|nr:hypothetical protein B6N25_11520 [Sphingobacteriales bacterium TSM_CSS]PSJ77596.1 T9SS C-terminal target domain-containing protein [Sphingobacteriales bacterium UPWRP_1]
MKKFTLVVFAALMGLMAASFSANAQCLTYAGGPYTDQGIDIAGCNGQSVSAPYAAWKNEIYFTTVVAGGNYTFSICDGYSPTVWGAEAFITVIEGGTAASGSVTGGTVLGFATGCTIDFDATVDGTVWFTITTVGGCGSAIQQDDNGVPTVTTNSGVECAPPVACDDPTVNPGVIDGTTDICFGETTDLTVTGAVAPNTPGSVSGYVWFVAGADLTGNTAPNTDASYFGAFPIQANNPTSPINFLNDGTQVPVGSYFFCSSVFGNATAGATAGFNDLTLDAACTQTVCFPVNFLEDGNPACTTCPVVNFSTVLDCDNQQFSISADVVYTGATGSFTITAGQTTQTITVAGPYSFGPFESGTEVSVSISNGDPACDSTETFTETCPTECERVTDGGFEEGATAWTQFSTNFGTPLCDPSCSNGTNNAYAGTFWCWFGGIDAVEDGSITQTIAITAPTATLTFYLTIPVNSTNGQDFMRVTVDDNEVFMVNESEVASYADYTLVTVDISAYADGGNHVLAFESSCFGGGTTNFFVDNISVEACGGVCIADAGSITNIFQSGNTITATAAGYTTTAGYTFLYLLVDGSGNIVQSSANGSFTVTGSTTGYTVYGVLSSDAELATVLSVTTIADLQALINVIGACADLTNALSVGIETAVAQNGFAITQVAPVPASDAVNVWFTAKGGNIQASVYDMTGRLVNNFSMAALNGSNNLRIDISNYAAGIYFVTLSNGNHVATAKVVKN